VLLRSIIISLVLAGFASAPSRSLANDLCSVTVFETDPRQAAANCTSVLSSDQLTTAERAEALKIRARSFHKTDRLDDAIRDYEEALKLAPEDAELHVRRGWTAFDKRDYDVVFAQANRALELKPGYAEVYALVGTALSMGGRNNFESAKAALDEAIRLQPLNPLYRFNRFGLLEENGFDNEAIDEADAILRLPLPLITKPGAAYIYLKHTTDRIAVEVKRAIILKTMGRTKEAEQAYDRAVELDPDALTYAMRAEFKLTHIAFIPNAPMPQMQMKSVQDDIDQAIALDPDYWFALNMQARLFLVRGEYASAAAYYVRALKGYPINGGMRWRYATALRQLGRGEEAITEATTAFRLDPGFMRDKLRDLRKFGYFVPTESEADLRPAIMDAVRACMIDERCG
jgi:tetratricopeptide (TPR) repeat protein